MEFLEKPFDDTQLRAAIDTAIAREQRRIAHADDLRGDAERVSKLTAREREVMEHAALGLHAKAAEQTAGAH